MIYAIKNLLDFATIVVTSENSFYPRENLRAGDPAIVFRFNADASNVLLTLDLAQNREVDFCSIHGHNLESGVTVTLRSRATPFGASITSGTEEAVFDVRSPAFFVRLGAPVNRRYWRLVFSGNNGSPIELGEVFLGLSTNSSAKPIRARWKEERQQVRHNTASGSVRVWNMTRHPTRQVTLFFTGSRVTLDAVRQDIYEGTKFGANPVVLVPVEAQSDVLLANVNAGLVYSTVPSAYYRLSLVASELGFGVIAS